MTQLKVIKYIKKNPTLVQILKSVVTLGQNIEAYDENREYELGNFTFIFDPIDETLSVYKCVTATTGTFNPADWTNSVVSTDIVDGTLLEKGVVQLSSDIDSTSETLAATPKAVKDAYDSLDAKVTDLIESAGTKLSSYPFSLGPSAQSQREFTIPMDTYDSTKDILLVFIGSTYTPDSEYIITNTVHTDEGSGGVTRGYFTLTDPDGVDENSPVDIVVWKNVATNSEEVLINGAMISIGSTPIDRIQHAFDDRGGTIDGDVTVTETLNVQGKLIIPRKVSDPASPEVGETWFRTDL